MAREEADADRGGEAQRVGRVRGLLLPGLKRWRIRRGLTQQQLADRVGARLQYVSRVEQGRGCNRAVAKKMAEALGVDLDELRAESGGEDPGTRYLHKAYLKLLLERVVGSAYAVLEEWELEEHVEGLPAEELVEVISRRRRELEFLEGLLASEAELHPQVHLFLEELVRERPAQDIRVLAMRRAWEPSEEGHERLTQAMRELL
jgi:transcriptional regulator with XRE-family HTH domain